MPLESDRKSGARGACRDLQEPPVKGVWWLLPVLRLSMFLLLGNVADLVFTHCITHGFLLAVVSLAFMLKGADEVNVGNCDSPVATLPSGPSHHTISDVSPVEDPTYDQ